MKVKCLVALVDRIIRIVNIVAIDRDTVAPSPDRRTRVAVDAVFRGIENLRVPWS